MDGDALKGQTEIGELKELVEFLKANEVAEFDLEKEGLKVRLKFQGAEPPAAAAAPVFDMAQMARLMASSAPAATLPAAAAALPVAGALPVEAAASAAPVPAAANDHIVKSPIVGTFYEAPSPGAPPFVKVGDQVAVGQVLCIVEAMKLMNEIEADATGEIVARQAISGEPVEYGQPLFSIRTR